MTAITLNRKILNIALPSIAGFLGLILFEVIDVFWVGKLGAKAVAALGASAFMEWTVFSLMAFSTTGCATLVGQFFGGGSKEKAFDVTREAFWLSGVLSILIALFMYIIVPYAFHWMGLDSETQGLAWSYYRVLIFGFPIIYMLHLTGNIFNAYGDTKTSMFILFCTLILNIILDPILIFGYFGIPKLGIAGASIASVICQGIGLTIRITYLRRRNYIGTLRSFGKFSKEYVYRMISIGTPAAVSNVVWTISFPLLTVIITKFGMDPLAGLNIANRIEGIPVYTCFGLSIAINTLVAQSFGRGDVLEVKRVVKRGLLIISLLLAPQALAFVLFPEWLISLLNSDPDVIRHGADYLRIIGYFEIFLGWEMGFEGAFNGLGNTKPYMLLRIIFTLGRFPVAYLLAFTFGMGIQGVWWAISTSMIIKGIGMGIIFFVNKKNRALLKSIPSCTT